MQAHNQLVSSYMASQDLLFGSNASCYDDGVSDGRTHPDVVTNRNGQNPSIRGEEVGTVQIDKNGGYAFTSNKLPQGQRPVVETDYSALSGGGNSFATEITASRGSLGDLAGKGARQLSGSGYNSGLLVRGTPGANMADEVLMFLGNGSGGYTVYNVTESIAPLIDFADTAFRAYPRQPCGNNGSGGAGGLSFEAVYAPATEAQPYVMPIMINPVGIPVLPPITIPVPGPIFSPGVLVPAIP